MMQKGFRVSLGDATTSQSTNSGSIAPKDDNKLKVTLNDHTLKVTLSGSAFSTPRPDKDLVEKEFADRGDRSAAKPPPLPKTTERQVEKEKPLVFNSFIIPPVDFPKLLRTIRSTAISLYKSASQRLAKTGQGNRRNAMAKTARILEKSTSLLRRGLCGTIKGLSAVISPLFSLIDCPGFGRLFRYISNSAIDVIGGTLDGVAKGFSQLEKSASTEPKSKIVKSLLLNLPKEVLFGFFKGSVAGAADFGSGIGDLVLGILNINNKDDANQRGRQSRSMVAKIDREKVVA